MEWVKLVAQPAFYLDAALLRAGEPAEVLFTRALAYCGGSDTRGRIDKTVVPMIVGSKTQSRVTALVREGLWLDRVDHYLIRSWDRWQDEHDAAAVKRQADRERLREKRAKERDMSQATRDMSRDMSRDTRATDSDMSQALSQEGRDSRALDVDVDVDVEERKTQPATPVVAPRLAAVPPAKPERRASRIPAAWPAAKDRADLWQWALDHTPAVAIGPETENWQDWHRAKGDTAKDWNASWRTWMRRAQKDAERSRPTRTNRTSAADSAVAQALAVADRFAQAELTTGEPA